MKVEGPGYQGKRRTHLLDEQLGSVWDRNLHDPLAALALGTPLVVPQHAARLAHLRLEGVRGNHESFEEQLCRAIPDQAAAVDVSSGL